MHCPLCYLNIKATEIQVVKMLSPDFVHSLLCFVISDISVSQELAPLYQVKAKPPKIVMISSEVFVVFA